MTDDERYIHTLRAAIQRTEPGAEIIVDDVVQGVHAAIAAGRTGLLTTDILRAALARIGGELTSTDILRADRDRDEPRRGATGREMHERLARSGPPLDYTTAGLPRRHQPRMSVSEALATGPAEPKSGVSADQPEKSHPGELISAGEHRTGERAEHGASDCAPGQPPAAMTADPEAERIRRYLDDLGRLSARHGVWIENGARGTLLRVNEDGAAGYHAWPWPGGGREGVYEIDSYTPGAAREADEAIVGDDHSPEGKERRARIWREENAGAIEEHNRSAGAGLLALLRSWGPLEEGVDDDYQLAVSALNCVCREQGIKLRASPDGIVLVPARDDWRGYDHRAAEHPVGGVLLVDRDDD